MFVCSAEYQGNFQHRFLHPNDLALEDIIWVDEVLGLHDAVCHIERCRVVGIDCEWKPVYEKGQNPKVTMYLIISRSDI